jgi:hypothetical protein
MKVSRSFDACALAPLLLALGCGPDSGVVEAGSDAHHQPSPASARFSEWSAPVNLGPVVNAPFNTDPVLMADNSPELSKDGLSLYFGSVRPGGSGSTDLYVSQRSCTDLENPDCSWRAPLNLGTTVNTSRIDGGPTLSQDGHWLYLISDRPGGNGSNDIYLSWRADKADDFGWGPPVNLGAPINTASLEAGPNPWGSEFYFHRGPVSTPQTADIYVSRMRGEAFSEPTIVEELSSPGFFTQRPSISSDGREMFFSSNRTGSRQGDIWTSTRYEGNVWGNPVNLGITVNSGLQEQTPMISDDGTMLFFASNRTGNFDLYVATRTVVPEE